MCRTGVEAVVEGAVYGTVASVGDCGVELLDELLSHEDEVAGRAEVMVAVVVVVVVVKAEALKVSSSVVCDLSVTVTGVVVRKTSVSSTGLSVRGSSSSDVLLLTVEGTAVRPKSTLPSLVWVENPSVPSWF